MAHIELLGGVRVVGEERRWEDFPRQKEAALLTLLALRPRQVHTREALADALWPDAAPEDARNNLRQTLHRLRQRLDGAVFLKSDQTALRLAEDVTTDIQELERALRRGDGAAAREIYRGELAPGCYEEPILAERNRIETLLEKAPLSPSPSAESPFVSTLPGRLTAFFGREREIEQARERLRAGARFLTLTGPGGMGKTRLAAEIAATWIETYRVVFAPLVGLTDVTGSDRFFAALTVPLGIETPRPTARNAVLRELRAHSYLLILDNLEQVIPDVAEPIRELLEAVPDLRCLATSRVIVPVPGAVELPLRPLPTDDATGMLTERIRQRSPDFAPADENAPILRAIAERLDGIPLALELAAGWAHLLSLQEILTALENRWTLLQTTRPDVPERHRSLRSVLEASVSRLVECDRRIFAELSVFHGFDAAAITAVCELTLPETRETLSRLRDVSLIVAEGAGRFSVLETLREYGGELLTAEQETDARRRHCRYYAAGEIAMHGHHSTDAAFYSRYEQEQPNLIAALRFGLTDTPEMISITSLAALTQFFHWGQLGRADLIHAFVPLLAALESRLPELTGAGHTSTLLFLAQLAWGRGDMERAEALMREFAATAVGGGILPLIELLVTRGKCEEAIRLAQDALAWEEMSGTAQGRLSCLNVLIHAHERGEDPDESFACYERLRAFMLAHPEVEGSAYVDVDRARALCARGEANIAEERVRAAIAHFTALEHWRRRAEALRALALVLYWQGRETESRIVLQEAATSARKRELTSAADSLEALLRDFPGSLRREWNMPSGK